MTDIDDATDLQLDRLLRGNFPGPVADDGFSSRLMHSLRPRRDFRRWLLPVAAIAGTALAWLALMPSPLWRQVAQEWFAGNPGPATAGVAALALLVGLISCAWSLEER